VLSGNYRLDRVVAEGGMGVVYEAQHLRLPRRFAVKVLGSPKDKHLKETALARFHREAEIAASLSHPNIVEVFDYQARDAEDGTPPYLVMELLEGEDLAERLRRTRRVPVKAALRILEEAAMALDVAHTRGVVHRDLKPANVFLARVGERDDFVKLLDFGVSKLVDSATLTHDKAMVGTPLYMSPEQAVGKQALTPQSDIFSLGTIAFEMLTGRRAFAAASVPSILYQIVHGATPTVSGKVPGLGPAVDAVFTRALAKRPEGRFPTASSFAKALAEAAGGTQPVSGATPSAPIVLHEHERTPTNPGGSTTDVDAHTADQTGPGGERSQNSPAGGSWLAGLGAGEPEPAILPERRPPSIGVGTVGEKWMSEPVVDDAQSSAVRSSARTRRIRIGAALGVAGLAGGAVALIVLLGTRGPRVVDNTTAAVAPKPAAPTVTSLAPPPAQPVQAPQMAVQPVVATRPAPPPPAKPLRSTVRLTFHVRPANARVLIDQKIVHGTSAELPARDGLRRVEISAPGYKSVHVDVPAGVDQHFQLRLDHFSSTPAAQHEQPSTPPQQPTQHEKRRVHEAAPVQDL
jgi:serine/threonine-protein kinase